MRLHGTTKDLADYLRELTKQIAEDVKSTKIKELKNKLISLQGKLSLIIDSLESKSIK